MHGVQHSLLLGYSAKCNYYISYVFISP